MGDDNQLTDVRPAISIQVRKAGTRDAGLYISQSHSKRVSGTGIRASSGLIVAYGKFAAFPRSMGETVDKLSFVRRDSTDLCWRVR